MPGQRRITISMLPRESNAGVGSGCTIVVDTLRATSTIVAALAAGAAEVITVEDESRARELARETGALLAGEREGLPPAGFDAGNSPVELAGRVEPGQSVVLFTTNGTRALCGAESEAVYAGALVNAAAIGREASGHSSVDIVCAGNAGGTRFSLEDFVTAAVIGRYIASQEGDWRLYADNDGARLAARLFASETDEAMLQRAAELIRASDHAGRTRALGLEADIAWATQPNRFDIVPRVAEREPGMAVLRAGRAR
ncbi:MAG: 2-phosphosulfolactate phosphatase [Dehalococcoidia bacterium]|nr:2-phosphosulfolactate phosphatase [Dehalococcoidia bacterium]